MIGLEQLEYLTHNSKGDSKHLFTNQMTISKSDTYLETNTIL